MEPPFRLFSLPPFLLHKINERIHTITINKNGSDIVYKYRGFHHGWVRQLNSSILVLLPSKLRMLEEKEKPERCVKSDFSYVDYHNVDYYNEKDASCIEPEIAIQIHSYRGERICVITRIHIYQKIIRCYNKIGPWDSVCYERYNLTWFKEKFSEEQAYLFDRYSNKIHFTVAYE